MKKTAFLLAAFSLFILAAHALEISDAPERRVNVLSKEVVIVDGGLWPNLTLLPGGGIVLAAFNQPEHGWVAGDVDAWRSQDGGVTWQHASTIAKRQNDSSNRMNHAVGFLKKENRLVAVVSGYADNGSKKWGFIRPLVTTSADNGTTWTELGEFDCGLVPNELVVPYGQMVEAHDGSLRFVVYAVPGEPNSPRQEKTAYMVKSADGGKTWSQVGCLGPDTSETAVIEVAPKEWLAISRTKATSAGSEKKGMTMRQLRSVDDGKTWADEGEITPDLNHPANLLRTQDGKLLLTYSDRQRNKILGRLSEDNGKTWGEPLVIYASWVGDGGYPSTVQLPNGEFVTAFYAKRSPLLDINKVQYHTGLVRWSLR